MSWNRGTRKRLDCPIPRQSCPIFDFKRLAESRTPQIRSSEVDDFDKHALSFIPVPTSLRKAPLIAAHILCFQISSVDQSAFFIFLERTVTIMERFNSLLRGGAMGATQAAPGGVSTLARRLRMDVIIVMKYTNQALRLDRTQTSSIIQKRSTSHH